VSRTVAFLACVLATLASGATAQAQRLELRRDQPEVAWAGCPAPGAPPRVTAQRRDEAARLAAQATEAAILGNSTEAQSLLARATQMDPTSAPHAYRHGRSLEDQGRPAEALAEYCRFLALAPGSPDAIEVRSRIDQITRTSGLAVPAHAAQAFAAGIGAYDEGRHTEAETAFGRASDAAPDWAAPVYNRAVVRMNLGRHDGAAADLRRYLELNPGAADFDQVLAVMTALRTQPGLPPMPSPTSALAAGILLPGLGHFTSGRPVMGALVLAAAAGAVAAGMLVERVDVDCLAPPVNGICPPDEVRDSKVTRPLLVPGIAIAAGIGLLGALDAYRGVRRSNAAAAAAPRRTGMTDGRSVTVRAPELHASAEGLRFELLRVRF
jgi:tetratricopeptide (TPR) repeat protein